MEPYHNALAKELVYYAQKTTQTLQSIYLGGGTPSTYPSHLLLDLSDILRSTYQVSPSAEITIEVNPGTITEEKINSWFIGDINRISLGVQSLNDQVLRLLNRHHSRNDTINALKSLSPKFNNISIDLMIGLPGISRAEWQHMLHEVVSWPITHISLYMLTLHHKTPLCFMLKKNALTLPDEEEICSTYQWSFEFLAQHGFGWYELSNFAKVGYESRHNWAYWKHKSYQGLGISAASFDGKRRYRNTKELAKYLQNPVDAIEYQETLSKKELLEEHIMLSIRTKEGISDASIHAYGGNPDTLLYKSFIQELLQNSLIKQHNNSWFLTPKGMCVEHEISQRIMNTVA